MAVRNEPRWVTTAGAPLVPSAVVLRGEHAGLLGRHLPSRRHPRLDDHDPVVGAGLRQIARTDPRSESSCRWSVLRSRNRRIYQGKTRLLRDRGSAHPPAEESFGGTALRRISPGVWAAEFRYCPQGWPGPRRFVVIRRPVPEEPSAQLHLFQMGGYSYQLLVTNLALTPLHLWRFYNQRARAELIIRELKDAYALGKIPTKDFWANEAFFQIVLLAYNLLNWFKRLCVPVHLQGPRCRASGSGCSSCPPNSCGLVESQPCASHRVTLLPQIFWLLCGASSKYGPSSASHRRGPGKPHPNEIEREYSTEAIFHAGFRLRLHF